MADRAFRPDERECAMLLAYLLSNRQDEVNREITRARLSELTVRQLFGRQRITPVFLLEVQDWLARAGWVLFPAGTSYAVVKLKVVEGWGRISSKQIDDDLRLVMRGDFDFADLEPLLLEPQDEEAD